MEGDPVRRKFNVDMYAGDMIPLEACPRGQEQRLLVAKASAVYDHIRILGSGACNPVPVRTLKKLTD